MNSCRKGKAGERAFRDVLREAGFLKAERGQQHAGGKDSPDVKCPELPSIHWEVKRCESGSLYKWVQQALNDAGGKTAIVAHKRNNMPWVFIMTAEHGLELIKETNRVDGGISELEDLKRELAAEKQHCLDLSDKLRKLEQINAELRGQQARKEGL